MSRILREGPHIVIIPSFLTSAMLMRTLLDSAELDGSQSSASVDFSVVRRFDFSVVLRFDFECCSKIIASASRGGCDYFVTATH